MYSTNETIQKIALNVIYYRFAVSVIAFIVFQNLGVCPGVRVNEGIAIVVSLFRNHCFISFLL